ncbi:hypothetical protein N7467_001236 [Penicillium canescens]|nr:hypothetical protein N7467_001236 [Penicillium canescens]
MAGSREIDMGSSRALATGLARAGVAIGRLTSDFGLGISSDVVSEDMNGTLPAVFPSVFGHEAQELSTYLQKGGGVTLDDKVLLSFDFCGSCQEFKPDHPAHCQEWAQRNFGQKRMDGSLSLSTPDGADIHGNFSGQSSFARHTIGSGLIIAVDLQPQRLELAKELRATHAVVGSDEDVVAQIQKISGSNCVDYCVDCAGIPQVVEKALDCLGTYGNAATVGAPEAGKRAGVDVFAHLVMGRQYIGCYEGDSIPGKICRMLPYIIEQHANGQFPYENVSIYPVKYYETAFKDIKDGKALKAVLLRN